MQDNNDVQQRGKIVWVTQETQHDFTAAEAFGEIKFLTNKDLSNTKNSLNNDALLSELSFKLKKYDPSMDSIVIAGSPYVSAAVFMLLGMMGIRKVLCLRWDNRDLCYRPLHIEFRPQ